MTISVNDDHKNIVGVGKIMFDTSGEVTWNIPHLHFLVDKTHHYEAVCLEFGLVSSDEELEGTINSLVVLVRHHILTTIMDGDGYRDFIETVGNRFMEDYWAAYRKIEFALAQSGNDLSHKIETVNITRAVKIQFDEEFQKALRASAKDEAEEMIKLYKKLNMLAIREVEYFELLEAA